jgi:hypothetical protein
MDFVYLLASCSPLPSASLSVRAFSADVLGRLAGGQLSDSLFAADGNQRN